MAPIISEWGEPAARRTGHPHSVVSFHAQSFRRLREACLEHSDLLTGTRDAHEVQPMAKEGHVPGVVQLPARFPLQATGAAAHEVPRTSDYELFKCSNVNIRYWSWSYRGCWHQSLPSS